MMCLQAGIGCRRQGSTVTDEDLVETTCRVINIGSRTRSFTPALELFAPDAELALETERFRLVRDRCGIEALISSLPEGTVFGYYEALREGDAVTGRFTAAGMGPEPALGRYLLRRAGDRIERLEIVLGADGGAAAAAG